MQKCKPLCDFSQVITVKLTETVWLLTQTQSRNAKCVFGEKRKIQMQLEEGKFLLFIAHLQRKSCFFTKHWIVSFWLDDDKNGFLSTPMFARVNFFSRSLVAYHWANKTLFPSIESRSSERKRKKMYAWTKKMCFNFSDTCTRVPHTFFYCYSFFLLSNYCLFWAVCATLLVCVCGGYFSDKNERNSKLK